MISLCATRGRDKHSTFKINKESEIEQQRKIQRAVDTNVELGVSNENAPLSKIFFSQKARKFEKENRFDDDFPFI